MAVKPSESEADWLAGTARGDERAFAALFRWYSRPLGAFVLKLTQSQELTEEIVQDTFITIWQRRETILQIENFSGYVYILCRNRTFAVLKKLAAERVAIAGYEMQRQEEEWLDSLDNPADHYRALIGEAVERLPAQQRKVFTMSRYERLKNEEIARRLNLSADTVKKHLQLAIKAIRNDLDGHVNSGIVLLLTTPLFTG